MAKIPEKVIPHTGAETVNYGVRHIFEVFYSLSTETPAGARPLWTGEKIENCKNEYKAFWNKALKLKASGKIRVVDQATWDKEVAAPDISSGKAENAKSFGQTGAFVIYDDGTRNYIQLPKITQFIQSIDGASENGMAQLDAIRNITGLGGMGEARNNSGNYKNFVNQASGAFYYDVSKDYYGSNGGIDQDDATLRLDASRVVPIADRVRPRNVQMALYIQVSNDKVDDAELEQAHLDRLYIDKVKNDIQKIKEDLQAELTIVRSDAAVSCMPDMSRAVFLEETDYNMNDRGCIFKLNVPGWLVPMSKNTDYGMEFDWSYTFSKFPGGLYYGNDIGVYGRWNRFTQRTGRFTAFGMVNGSWRIQMPYPVSPNRTCYFSLEDATSPSNGGLHLWFVPSVSVPHDIDKKLFVTRVGKKYASPCRDTYSDGPLLISNKLNLFHSRDQLWTSNFNISGSTWKLKTPSQMREIIPFSYTLGQGTLGSGAYDAGQQYWLANTGRNDGSQHLVWWRNGGTHIIRYITEAEINAVKNELASNGNRNTVYSGKTPLQWLDQAKNKWVMCVWTTYRKKYLVKDTDISGANYDSYDGAAAWNYWQDIYMVSKTANLAIPPVGASKWDGAYGLRGYTADKIPSLNWVGVSPKNSIKPSSTEASLSITSKDYCSDLSVFSPTGKTGYAAIEEFLADKK